MTRHAVIAQTPHVADHAPLADPTAVEPKVRAATIAASGSAATLPFVLWLLGTYVFDGAVPMPVEGFVGFVITGAATFAAGYAARHVDRTHRAG